MKLIGRKAERERIARQQVHETLDSIDVYTEARLIRTQRDIEVARMRAARRRQENQ